MTISIIGTGITKFGELWNLSLADLFQQAIELAITDANLVTKNIDAIFVGNKAAGSFENQHHLNALVSQMLPHHPPTMRLEGACASGGLAMLAAEYALLAGVYKTVLVVGAEKMSDVSSNEVTKILSGAANNESEIGSTFPAIYALLAQAHMQKFGTTREQLSSVAVKNHRHAMSNPNAQFHKEFSLDQISHSQLVADPLRLLDCSPISDGAAAVILTTNKNASNIRILGFGHGQDSMDLASRKSMVSFSATTQAAKLAYFQAKLSPKNIQAAEVHDCFTIAEIFALEDLGFFAPGQAGEASLSNKTTYGGDMVVNPSGGLKACGHPVGATGVKQIAFLAQQLKQEKFKTVLAHNVGGSGATAVVHILGVK